MAVAIDLSGRRFGKLTAIRLLKKRGALGERIWLCRCDCGKATKVRATLLLQGRTESCGCLRAEAPAKRTTDLAASMAGEQFGSLKVVELSNQRTRDGHSLLRCRCLHRRRDGQECGREVLARPCQLRSGWRKSCGHHRKGRFTKGYYKQHKIPKTIVDGDGVTWTLPSRLAKAAGLKRVRGDRQPGITTRRQPTGHIYWNERLGLKEADRRKLILKDAVIDGYRPLDKSAKLLKRSSVRIREVAREEFPEETLECFLVRGKPDRLCKAGRLCKKTYVPLALHEKLKAYFAEAPEKQIAGILARWAHRKLPDPKESDVDVLAVAQCDPAPSSEGNEVATPAGIPPCLRLLKDGTLETGLLDYSDYKMRERRQGPPQDDQVDKALRACYELYVFLDKSRATAWGLTGKLKDCAAPKKAKHVAAYAERWAQRFIPTLPPKGSFPRV
jgi:hypothetical protein